MCLNRPGGSSATLTDDAARELLRELCSSFFFLPTQCVCDANGRLWRPPRMARRMHPTNSLTVRRDGSTTSAIARQHELQLPLLLGLLDNRSSNHEQMDVFHLLLG